MPAAPRVKLPTRTGGGASSAGGGALRSPANPGRFGPRTPANPILQLAGQQKQRLADTEMQAARQIDADWHQLVAVPLGVELTRFAHRYQRALDALRAQEQQDAEDDEDDANTSADGGGVGGGAPVSPANPGPRGPDALRRGGVGGASPTVPSTWLLDRHGGDAHGLLRSAKGQITKFAQATQKTVAHAAASASAQGMTDGQALLAIALQPLVDASGGELDAEDFLQAGVAAARKDAQFALLSQLMNAGGPLAQLLGSMPQESADQAYRTLLYGLGHGENPQALVSDLQQILNSSRSRALTISRTEMMNAYRGAQIDNYRANSDVVQGWIWLADLGSACPLCTDLNGEIHPLDDDMVSHPRCRCSPAPYTKSWDDILSPVGMSADDLGLEDTSLQVESGEDWFARQDEATQRAILGPSAFNAYQGGALQLSDLVGRNADGSYYQKSLKEAGLDANAWLGKGPNAGVPVRVKIPGGGYTYVTPGPLSEEVPQFNTADREAGWQSIDEQMSNLRAFSPDATGGAGSSASSYELTEDDRAFAQSIRDQIPAGGVTSADDAIALGDQVRARVEDNLSELKGYAQEAQGIRERAPNLTDEERAWAMGDKAAVEAHGGYHVFGKNSAEWAYQEQYQAQMRAYLGEVRDVGGVKVNINTEHGAYDPRMADAIAKAMETMPADWLRASNDLGELYVSKSLERSSGGWFTHLDNKLDGSLAIRYTKGTGDAQIESTALHEMTHRMEMTLQKLGDIEAQFYDARTAGEAFIALTNGIKAKTKLDEWLDEYLGREPLYFPREPMLQPDGTYRYATQSYELLTMGAEMLFAPGVDMSTFALWRDSQYVSFVLGVFLGVQA